MRLPANDGGTLNRPTVRYRRWHLPEQVRASSRAEVTPRKTARGAMMRGLIGLKADRTSLAVAFAAALAVMLLFGVTVAGAHSASGAATSARVLDVQVGVTPAPGTIVVVRRSAGQDSLWSVDPVSKAATELLSLPFRPERVVRSPGGARLAYLPTTAGPYVYIYTTTTGVLHRWSLAARGVREVDSLAWLSSSKLLVAGKSTPGYAFYPYRDRLYAFSVTSGRSSRFRDLAGTEPTVSPADARLVFVRFTRGGRVASGSPLHWVTEQLFRLKLASATKPRMLLSGRYADGYDIRLFNDPSLSADGRYLVTSTTGSDISVSYMVRSAATGKALRTIHTELAGHDATAWSNAADQVAYWTMTGNSSLSSELHVYDTASATTVSSSGLASVAVSGFAWSSDDALLAYSLRGLASADDQGELWTIDPSSLSAASAIDLGAGGMPVYVP
jgi:hypothetical protein